MRTKTTFSTIFWLQSSRAINNEALLYARITVNQKRLNVSLKKKITVSIWDPKLKKAKGKSAEAKQINQYLTQVNAQLFQIYQDLNFKNQLITAQLIKSNFLGEGENHKTLNEIIGYHSSKMKTTFAKGTIINYGITENYISKFLEQKRKTSDIYLNQLDYKFLCDFEDFLHNLWPKGHPKALGQNTVIKHIQRLRKLVTLSFHLEWINKDPFIRWKPIFEKTNRQFLSDNELSNLETYDFISERLDRVRDLFIFSCYTGIAYVDLMKLTKNNIAIGIDGNQWIITKRQKTKTPVKVPILERTKAIIDKYDNHPITQVTGMLLPSITNEKLNVFLKEVANFCGIKKNLTFHMARHTFATTVTLTNGVPIETVSKLLGHTKISTTQIYARVIERKVSDDMNALKLILNKNEEEKDITKRKSTGSD